MNRVYICKIFLALQFIHSFSVFPELLSAVLEHQEQQTFSVFYLQFYCFFVWFLFVCPLHHVM